jgi:hypothetical protein
MDPCILCIALRSSEISKTKLEGLYPLGLRYIADGYEDGTIWFYKIQKSDPEKYEEDIEKEIDTDTGEDSLYGIEIVGTWNGIIDIEDPLIKERIKEAKILFKKITGKEGRLLFIGYQT